ncbi:hypothetical protein [Streptomyces drozdowiczii]|uniref:hypothetical protein n=1 Tax=Streptomyces drozdowiczii TaxID=202862 RepID=UPI00403C0160
MTKADDRNRLENDFHGLAGRVDRLVKTCPDATLLDSDKLSPGRPSIRRTPA